MPPLLRRLALSALVAATLAGCGGGGAGSGSDAAGSGQAGPTTVPSTAAPATTATPAPAPTSLRPPPPELGIVAARKRQAAPDLSVTAFDGRSITLGGFRGQPVVVNFFESW
jgi:hypothetical protein